MNKSVQHAVTIIYQLALAVSRARPYNTLTLVNELTTKRVSANKLSCPLDRRRKIVYQRLDNHRLE